MLEVDRGVFSLPSDHHLSRLLKTPIYNIQQQAENFSDRSREQLQRDTNVPNCPAHHKLAPALVAKIVVIIEDQRRSDL